MNNKIKSYLKAKYNQQPRTDADQKIVAWLDSFANNKSVWEVSYLKNELAIRESSLYRCIYRLAWQGKIGLASRKFHDLKASPDIGALSSGVSIVVWSTKHHVNVPVLPEWIDTDAPIQQAPLFGYDFSALSSEELDEVIKRAQWQQIARGVTERYAVMPKEMRNKLTDIFCKINITDPVYYAHSDEDVSFMTYTAIKNMPIDIVIDTGFGPTRFNCKALTIFGEEILKATGSMFSGSSS